MKKRKKVSRKRCVLAVLVVVAIVIFIVVLIKLHPKRLENKMEQLVKEYYEKEIKGNVVGIGKQIVTLKALSDSGYDIGSFKNCDQKSYSYVIVENPEETDKDKIKYTIENHLDCD